MYSFGKNQDPNYASYIRATQSGVVRLDQGVTPDHVAGLCTDRLMGCLGILIKSHNNERMSLIHTATGFLSEAIIRECQWVDKTHPVTIEVFKGLAYDDPKFVHDSELFSKTIPRLQHDLKALEYPAVLDLDSHPTPTWGVCISRQGKIVTLGTNQIQVGQYGPLPELRHTTNMLQAYGGIIIDRGHPLDIQFDASAWTVLPTLMPPIQRLIDSPPALPPALEIFQQNVDEYKRLRAQYAKEIETANRVGMHHYKKDDFAKASLFFKRAWTIVTPLYGETSKHGATLTYNIGCCHQSLDEVEQAHEYFDVSLGIRKKLFGGESDEVQKVEQRLMTLEGSKSSLSPRMS